MLRWLFAFAACGCGRVGFGEAVDGAAVDGADDQRAPGMVGYAGSSVTHVANAAAADTFSITAKNAGDAMLLHVFCETGTPPAAVTIAGPPAWSWTMLTSVGSAGAFRGAAFGAIAPDTIPASFTLSWSIGADTCSFLDEMGDELTSTDPGGGTMTFEDAAVGAAGAGNCDTMITTHSANAALWTACTTNCVTAPPTGFTASSDDGNCDASAFRLTTDPANTVETISFTTSASTTYIATSVSVRAR